MRLSCPLARRPRLTVVNSFLWTIPCSFFLFLLFFYFLVFFSLFFLNIYSNGPANSSLFTLLNFNNTQVPRGNIDIAQLVLVPQWQYWQILNEGPTATQERKSWVFRFFFFLAVRGTFVCLSICLSAVCHSVCLSVILSVILSAYIGF